MTVIDQDTGREFALFNSEELKEEIRQYWEIKCEHPTVTLGQVKYKNGSTHIRKVCTDCGEFIGDTIKKSEEHSALPAINQELIRETYHKNRRLGHEELLQKHVRIQRKRDAGFQKEYVKYLSSDDWKQRREKVLKRAGFICEGCLEKPATIVHLLTYRHIYREMLFDLVALCKDCHATCHPDKNELSDEEFLTDDLPCYGCRWHGSSEEGSWCVKFDTHTVIALTDRERCGPRASGLDPLH